MSSNLLEKLEHGALVSDVLDRPPHCNHQQENELLEFLVQDNLVGAALNLGNAVKQEESIVEEISIFPIGYLSYPCFGFFSQHSLLLQICITSLLLSRIEMNTLMPIGRRNGSSFGQTFSILSMSR